MRRIKYFFAALLACAVLTSLPSCDKDKKDEPGGGNSVTPGGSMSGDGDYGQLGSNMVATGGTRAVSYTQAILLGTVDFSKMGDTHTFGVVYMEAVSDADNNNKPFDYNLNLVETGKNVHVMTVNTTADGKFEKQLIDLMPGTTYYYRSYIKIGSTYNYADVKYFSTLDPAPSINLVTGEPEEVCALSTMMVGRASIGNVNIGLDQAEISGQMYGFLYSDNEALNSPETLTMEYWENWDNTHFDTQKKPEKPVTVTTNDNINSVLRELVQDLIPGTTYYYRTVFTWKGKYFYSPEVMSFTTLGPSSPDLTVGTRLPSDVMRTKATLNGHIPFEKVGTNKSLTGGFMISKKYSHESEFVLDEDMKPVVKDINVVQCTVGGVDFFAEVTRLEPNTEYYVVAFVLLGREKDTIDKYGDKVEGKPIYLYGDVIKFTTDK